MEKFGEEWFIFFLPMIHKKEGTRGFLKRDSESSLGSEGRGNIV